MEKSNQPESGGPEVSVKAASRFRTALPQVLASTAKNMILLDLGMTVAFPTIVIPALFNTQDPLALNEEQVSWFGSIMYICQPVGSVFSGIVLEQLGRKRSMLLVNFPHVLGWFIFYFANSVPMLYVSSVIMGLGVGFMEAPIITYVGEISQPELRGMLTSYAGIFVQLGFFLEYLLGTISDWRTAAAISAAVPMATVIAITQVPETPIWLLSRGRREEAEKALCWLRGWVRPAAVRKEFDELVLYSENMKELKRRDAAASTRGAVRRKLHDLCRPQTLRPLLLVIMFFFFQHWSGFSGMRPYMVKVFEEYGLPLDAHWVTVVTGVIGMVGNIVCMVGVPWWGKRPISLVSMAVSCMSCLLLGGYAYAVISPGEVATAGTRRIASWVPLTLFSVLVFTQSVGVLPIPWMILSEVFPFRSRGLASGIAAAASYVLAFLASKTFLSLKSSLHLHGVFWLYGIFSFLGFVIIYLTFTETEGRSLEDIEEFYKKGIRGKIPKRGEPEGSSKENLSHKLQVISHPRLDTEDEIKARSFTNDEEMMINNTLYNSQLSRNGETRKSLSTNNIRGGLEASTETLDTTFTASTADLQPQTEETEETRKQNNVNDQAGSSTKSDLQQDHKAAIENPAEKTSTIGKEKREDETTSDLEQCPNNPPEKSTEEKREEKSKLESEQNSNSTSVELVGKNTEDEKENTATEVTVRNMGPEETKSNEDNANKATVEQTNEDKSREDTNEEDQCDEKREVASSVKALDGSSEKAKVLDEKATNSEPPEVNSEEAKEVKTDKDCVPTKVDVHVESEVIERTKM